eukprot:1955775-Amphidinium_carterae.1
MPCSPLHQVCNRVTRNIASESGAEDGCARKGKIYSVNTEDWGKKKHGSTGEQKSTEKKGF